MSDLFKLVGSWSTSPHTGALLSSGAISLGAQIQESLALAFKNADDFDLVTDAPIPVSFGGVTNANVVVVFANRPITALVTSAAGVNQAIPVDGWWIHETRTTPVTAIDLVRSPAQETKVSVFIGQKT